jgi:S1-C subfamily serine protease
MLIQDNRKVIMRIVPVFLLLACSVCALAQTNLVSFTNRHGTVYENVRIVRTTGDALIYRDEQGVGGGSVKLIELPDDFLRTLGRDPAQLVKDDLDKAIASGAFRIVEGTVYDLRKKQADWFSFQNVKLVQRLYTGAALVETQPDNIYSIEVIHVINLPDISDTERFSFRAKLIGTYTYINKRDDQRVVRSYDAGRVCGRNEIPATILKEGLASAQTSLPPPRAGLKEILPDSEADKLSATGTGFFITEDGYLVTNDHVIRDAKTIRVRTRSETLDAQLVKASHLFDLAVLRVKGSFRALPLDFSREVHLGDAVFTIGFPNVDIQGSAPKYTDGKISSLSGAEDDPSQYQISVPVQPGNSGGGLVSESGCVIGVVRSKLNDLTSLVASGSVPQNVNYAVKVKYLRDLLETIPGVIEKTKQTSARPKTGDRIKEVEDATVIVLVY